MKATNERPPFSTDIVALFLEDYTFCAVCGAIALLIKVYVEVFTDDGAIPVLITILQLLYCISLVHRLWKGHI